MTVTSDQPFVGGYRHRLETFVGTLATRKTTVLGTLGPVGTSSQDAAVHLRDELAAHGLSGTLSIQLFDRFDPLLTEVCAGGVDLALVPSAYRDATAFHWHPDLELAFHFARSTPMYGLAAGPAGPPPEGELAMATMAETRTIFDSLCPPALRARVTRVVDARSTHHAAQLVADGTAQLGLTNDTNRGLHHLSWVVTRPGAEVVWLLFRRFDEEVVR